jgi:hypothetical protein
MVRARRLALHVYTHAAYIFGKVRTKKIRQCTNKRHTSSRQQSIT